MPDPTDYSRPMLPELHYGKVGTKAKVLPVDEMDDDINDDEGAPQWVIDVLGFDPRDV